MKKGSVTAEIADMVLKHTKTQAGHMQRHTQRHTQRHAQRHMQKTRKDNPDKCERDGWKHAKTLETWATERMQRQSINQ